MVSNILDSLGLGRGINVHLCVSPSGNLEMTILDSHGNVKSYSQVHLNYNEAQREIANYDELKTTIETLFQSYNIVNKKVNIHLSLPTVWFGYKEGLPLLLDDNAITNIVIGELEQSFIFKRKEPLPFWFDALVSTNSDSRSIFYTAVQKDVVDKFRDILTDVGATLVSVGCSLFADLKGLYATGYASDLMNDDGNSWSLLVINNTGYQMLGMQGKKILEYYEEALPLKSYDGEEIYSAIENSLQIALMSTPSNSIVILSETDLVSAEILAKRIQFGGSLIPVDDNQYRKEPLMEMSLNIVPEDQVKVSLHTIGAISPDGVLPVTADFIATTGGKAKEVEVIEIPLSGDKVIQLTPSKATIIAAIILGIVMIPVGAANVITQNISNKKQEESANLDTQITAIDEQLKQYEDKDGKVVFDPIAEIEKVLKNNRTKIMAYTALGESIPKDLYLTYFMTGDDGIVDIKGCANTVEDVYVFFKNIKDSMPDSKLRLSKLDLKSGSLDVIINSTVSTVDNAPYVFEITNMTDTQLKSFMSKLTGADKKKDDNNANAQQPAPEQEAQPSPAN